MTEGPQDDTCNYNQHSLPEAVWLAGQFHSIYFTHTIYSHLFLILFTHLTTLYHLPRFNSFFRFIHSQCKSSCFSPTTTSVPTHFITLITQFFLLTSFLHPHLLSLPSLGTTNPSPIYHVQSSSTKLHFSNLLSLFLYSPVKSLDNPLFSLIIRRNGHIQRRGIRLQ